MKGYQYLLPIAGPAAVLAAGFLADTALARTPGRRSIQVGRAIRLGATAAVVAWLVSTSWGAIAGATNSTSFLAGTGGVPGGQEAGKWIEEHTPLGTEMLAIGPSMANILEFYGHRQALGLSVSPNPLHRNPVYTPVGNPDLLLRTGQIQYIVWDAYSAGRSRFALVRVGIGVFASEISFSRNSPWHVVK